MFLWCFAKAGQMVDHRFTDDVPEESRQEAIQTQKERRYIQQMWL